MQAGLIYILFMQRIVQNFLSFIIIRLLMSLTFGEWEWANIHKVASQMKIDSHHLSSVSKAQNWLLFPKFAVYLLYVDWSLFCGQILKRSANLSDIQTCKTVSHFQLNSAMYECNFKWPSQALNKFHSVFANR